MYYMQGIKYCIRSLLQKDNSTQNIILDVANWSGHICRIYKLCTISSRKLFTGNSWRLLLTTNSWRWFTTANCSQQTVERINLRTSAWQTMLPYTAASFNRQLKNISNIFLSQKHILYYIVIHFLKVSLYGN